jgi:hypothetical protein
MRVTYGCFKDCVASDMKQIIFEFRLAEIKLNRNWFLMIHTHIYQKREVIFDADDGFQNVNTFRIEGRSFSIVTGKLMQKTVGIVNFLFNE